MSFSDLLTPRSEVLSDDGIEGIIDLANVNVRRRRLPLEARPSDFFALTYPGRRCAAVGGTTRGKVFGSR